jgi:hypothetical protein
MARHKLVTLSNTNASLISDAGIHSGKDITIQNVSETAIVYIGGTNVTTSNYGYKLLPGAAWSVELPPRDSLYSISDTDGSQVAVLKVGLED